MVNIVPFDDRLLFFRSLAHGLSQGVISKAQCAEQKKEGARMTVRFAERFYTPWESSYLQLAASVVLGVINLGIEELCKDDLGKASALLCREGVQYPFRAGWTLIERLTGWVHDADRTELMAQDFGVGLSWRSETSPSKEALRVAVAERFALDIDLTSSGAEIGEARGLELFREFRKTYRDLALAQRCLQWVTMQMHQRPAVVSYGTYWWSLVACSRPAFEVRLSDCRKLVAEMRRHPRQVWTRFIEKVALERVRIPQEHQRGFVVAFNVFTPSLKAWLQTARSDTIPELVARLSEFIIVVPDELSDTEYVAEVESAVHACDRKEVTSLLIGEEMPGRFSLEDPTVLRVTIQWLATFRNLASHELNAILRHPSDFWKGQIPWHESSWEDIGNTLRRYERQKRQEVLADIFARQLPAMDRDWWHGMPLDLATEMFSILLPAERMAFVQMVKSPSTDAILADATHNKAFHLVPFLVFAPTQWPVLWVEEVQDAGKAQELLNCFSSEVLGWRSRTEMFRALYPVAQAISKHWRDTSLDNAETEATPFFAPYLAGALWHLLTPNEFEDIKNKLAQEI